MNSEQQKQYDEEKKEYEQYLQLHRQKEQEKNDTLTEEYNVNLSERIRNVFIDSYHEALDSLRGHTLLHCKVIKKAPRIWTFCQFSDIKYIAICYQYGSQNWGKAFSIFGPYNGTIEDAMQNPDNINICKYDEIKYSSDKYQDIINEIYQLNGKQLKDKCIELSLPKSGSKPYLRERILITLLDIGYL